MAFRLYIVPVVGDGSKTDPRRPKYFASNSAGLGRTGVVPPGWGGMDYGFEPWMVVGADLSASDDALIVGFSDAFALPFDLTPTLTAGQVTNVRTKLEAINVPAGWVSTALTWTQVVRIVLGMFLVLQRYAAIHGVTRLFAGGVTLETTIGSLPASARQDLTSAATSFGLDTSSVTGSTTVRQALKILADQLVTRPYVVNGIAL